MDLAKQNYLQLYTFYKRHYIMIFKTNIKNILETENENVAVNHKHCTWLYYIEYSEVSFFSPKNSVYTLMFGNCIA